MTNADADTQFALWSGVCYVMPLLGGWVADSYLGGYRCKEQRLFHQIKLIQVKTDKYILYKYKYI